MYTPMTKTAWPITMTGASMIASIMSPILLTAASCNFYRRTKMNCIGFTADAVTRKE